MASVSLLVDDLLCVGGRHLSLIRLASQRAALAASALNTLLIAAITALDV